MNPLSSKYISKANNITKRLLEGVATLAKAMHAQEVVVVM